MTPNQPKTPLMAFRIPAAVQADIRRIAAERGVTLTAVVIEWIEEGIRLHATEHTK